MHSFIALDAKIFSLSNSKGIDAILEAVPQGAVGMVKPLSPTAS